LDHQQFLGDTIEKIAAEKGGIIKPGIPVVMGENPPEVLDVLKSIAANQNAPFLEVNSSDTGLKTDLGGIYQKENMRTVYAAINILRKAGWNLPEKAVQKGALHVVESTGLRGRWETLSLEPLTIADVGHNEEGVSLAMEMLSNLPKGQRHIVWGMVSDKDAAAIFNLLPKDASYYWCRPDVPRGKDVQILKTEAAQFGLHGNVHPTVTNALQAARHAAVKGDVIFVGGSVFVVAEVL
jgi:dihydrofolate synthase/folylpolyglutamate synthase